MAEGTGSTRWGDDDLTERGFYRAELGGRTLVIGVPPDAGDIGLATLGIAAGELRAAGARLVLVASTPGVADRVGLDHELVPVPDAQDSPALEVLGVLWHALRAGRVAVVDIGPDASVPTVASRLAVRLGAPKLVLTHELPTPELATPGFVDLDDLAAHPELSSPPWREVLDPARAAIAGGVDSVNLCHLDDLDTELFTYEGAGMLLTAAGYLDIGPLRVDGFPAVERLLHRGQDEGFLRPRPPEEITRFLFTGFGARIAATGHLAGIGGLEVERYRADGAGEVVGLYAISRFVGEGVGRQLVAALVEHGEGLGLSSVFACTTAPAAVAFFERCGFSVVPVEAVPSAKWRGYDDDRRENLVAMVRRLDAAAGT